MRAIVVNRLYLTPEGMLFVLVRFLGAGAMRCSEGTIRDDRPSLLHDLKRGALAMAGG